jgi:fucose permease
MTRFTRPSMPMARYRLIFTIVLASGADVGLLTLVALNKATSVLFPALYRETSVLSRLLSSALLLLAVAVAIVAAAAIRRWLIRWIGDEGKHPMTRAQHWASYDRPARLRETPDRIR